VIVRKYETEGGKGAGGYAEIARRAWQLGRNKLATKVRDVSGFRAETDKGP
jgi:hypothetical protein